MQLLKDKKKQKKKSVLASQFHSNSDQQCQNGAHGGWLMPFSKEFSSTSLYRMCIRMIKSSFFFFIACCSLTVSR